MHTRSVIAVAASDITVWELRKSDFDDLLVQIPELSDRVRSYIHRAGVDGYLVDRHQMDKVNTARWMRKAMRSVDTGQAIRLISIENLLKIRETISPKCWC